MDKLAIVIPAYKASFFKQTMKSIAMQTCKEFTVYVGDDASTSNIFETLQPFRAELDIVYKRFEFNMGGKNLVGHWHRCMEMVQDENWIWLFSDDDAMEPMCVELFYKQIHNFPKISLVHFNLQVINGEGSNIYKTKKFDPVVSLEDYFYNVINRKVHSCVVEYIFRRDIFNKVEGFETFDLAWSSDTATWMKIALYSDIYTIEDAMVKWRTSGLNISSLSEDPDIVVRKTNAVILFFRWAKDFFEYNNLHDRTSISQKFRWLLVGVVYTDSLDYNQKYALVNQSISELQYGKYRLLLVLQWIYEELLKRVKYILKYQG